MLCRHLPAKDCTAGFPSVEPLSPESTEHCPECLIVPVTQTTTILRRLPGFHPNVTVWLVRKCCLHCSGRGEGSRGRESARGHTIITGLNPGPEEQDCPGPLGCRGCPLLSLQDAVPVWKPDPCPPSRRSDGSGGHGSHPWLKLLPAQQPCTRNGCFQTFE